MKKFSVLGYPQSAKRAFSFLWKELGFSVQEEDFGAAYRISYGKGDIRIILDYDFKDNFFYFVIIRGKNTQFPNDMDRENIKTFYEFAQKFEPGTNAKKLQPDEDQYLDALNANAHLLKVHGKLILAGREWF